MKATELRIGNLITVKDAFLKVSEISEKYITIEDPITGLYEFEVELALPIPLNRDWHRAFNAIEISEKSFSYPYRKAEFILDYNYQRDIWWVEYQDHNNQKVISLPAEIKYVHELQNFWRFNTGEELEIKPRNTPS